MLTGIVPILPTIFHPDGRLDLATTVHVAERLCDEGASGLGLLGLASETFSLTADERVNIVKAVRKAIDRPFPLVVGLDATSLHTGLLQAQALLECGADHLMALPPHLVKPSRQGLVDYFGELGRLSGSVMVQDAPATSGVDLDIDLLSELSRLDGVTSFKIETPESSPKMVAFKSREPDVVLLGGRNAVDLPVELAAGAAGSMPACEFTAELAGIYERHRPVEDIDEDFSSLLSLLEFGIRPRKGWIVHKHLLARRGAISCDVVRHPAERLTPSELSELDQLFNEWSAS